MAEHEGLQRAGREFETLCQLDFVIEQGFDAFIVGLGEDRRHDEGGQEKRQADEDSIRWALLKAQPRSQQ